MSLSYPNFKQYILNDEENNKDLYEITTELQFFSSQMKKIPRIVANFSVLKILNCSRNKLVSVPKEIFGIKTLVTVNLSENLIIELVDEICELPNLKNLILVSNKLKKLPENIGKLTKLELLLCSKNELENIPASLWTISSLKEVRLSNNFIKEIGNLSPLINLEILYLDHNAISVINNCFDNLTNLIKLDLSYNKTKDSSVSESNELVIANIFELSNLEYFKNDFNVESKFCVVCKKETNTHPPCGHYICSVCANKKMLEKFNDDYETTCPTCNQTFKTNELKEDYEKYEIIKKNDVALLEDQCSNIKSVKPFDFLHKKTCECGKC